MDDDVRAFVIRTAEEREIRFIRLWFTDILGFLKSFAIPAEELPEALTEGVGFDGSAIDGFARVQEADMVAHPDPSTFQILPWRPGMAGVARMFCDIRTPEGTLFEGDPRAVLRRAMTRASDMGLSFYVGPEIEYFLFRDAKTPEPLDVGTYFDLTPLDVGSDFRRRVIDYLEQLGVPVKDSHHAIAASQHEVDLRHTDALTMADSVMTFRLAVKEVAQELGVYATFMPKPIQGVDGSSLHTHMSLFEGGRNAFFDPTDTYYLSKTARSFVAGLLRHAREISAVTNQWVNSYKRLGPGLRSAAVRLLGGEQPIGAGARSADETRQGGLGAGRVPRARPRVQPLPGVRADPHRRPAGGRARVRAAARGDERHLLHDRGRAGRRGDRAAP